MSGSLTGAELRSEKRFPIQIAPLSQTGFDQKAIAPLVFGGDRSIMNNLVYNTAELASLFGGGMVASRKSC